MTEPHDLDDDVIDAEILDDTDLVPVDAALRAPTGLSAHEALLTIRLGIAALDDMRAELVLAGDVEGLANGTADIAAVRGDLGVVEHTARRNIADLLDAAWLAAGKMKVRDDGTYTRLPEVDVENLGRVKVEGGRERKDWQSEALLRALIAGAIIDPETGELLTGSVGEVAEAVYEAIAPCLPLTGSLSWRVGQLDKVTGRWTGLRGRGIDPDDWCDNEIKDRVARVPKRAEEGVAR